MSLSKLNLSKNRKLSLLGVKAKASPKVGARSKKEAPLTIDEKALKELVKLRRDGEEVYNKLVNTFGLVSEVTNERVKLRKEEKK